MLCELPHDGMLCEVGVLILIYEDEMEAVLVACAYVGVLAEEGMCIDEDVIEVEGIGLPAACGISCIDVCYLWHARGLVGAYACYVVGVCFGRDETVLCC